MKHIYLYADEVSFDVLLNQEQKIVMIGGDTGNANFGDILQLRNSLRIVKESRRLATVAVMVAHAISSKGFPEWARAHYGSDAIVFAAEYPLLLDEDSPKLKLVGEIKNIAAVQLYGGGFLNSMWGDYILSIVEYFLRLSPTARYFMSGQQVTAPYQTRVAAHVRNCNPTLFGVRDELSQISLHTAGISPLFSFDDATEALTELTASLPLKCGNGLLLHLNASDYTSNKEARRILVDDLSLLRSDGRALNGVTLFQAFRDIRHDVLDSRETVKELDATFPFSDVRLIELAQLAYEGDGGLLAPIVGEIGYSCSYHVALWLQLAGIPCWLRSNNPFYDQKSKALQVTQDFPSFADDPRLADHSANLERRAQWRERLIKELHDVPEVQHVCKVPFDAAGPAPWPFFYKGTPTLEDRLRQATEEASDWRARADVAAAELPIAQAETLAMGERIAALQVQVREGEGVAHAQEERINALSAQLTEVGSEAHRQRERAESAEACVKAAQADLHSQGERLEALTAQLTEVGNEAHRQRERAEGAEGLLHRLQTDLMDVRQRLAATEANLGQLFVSRSWRLTRPLRGLARYVRHGHFDSEGNVGWFALAQKVGRRLPVSAELRRRLGSFLSRLRRKG